MSNREYRTMDAELRTSKSDPRKIEGRAVVYNQTVDLGYFREKVAPGAFTRALKEKQDIRFLVNHDPNLILGRTTSNTLSISEDEHGVNFSVDMPDTQLGKDTYTLIKRGDISGCSFGFVVTKESVDYNGDTPTRTIEDLDCFDLSTVCFPAYPTTSVSARSIEDVSNELRAKKPVVGAKKPADADPNAPDPNANPNTDPNASTACACRCRACFDGDCRECDMHINDCQAENCNHETGADDLVDPSERATTPPTPPKPPTTPPAGQTLKVDGEDLTAGAFLYVGDPDKTTTWALPWKFSSAAKTKTHLRNALARFPQTKTIPAAEKPGVYKKLVAQCQKYGIDVEAEAKASSLDVETAKRRTYVASLSL
jgi:HK97 family phage prohead protease